MVKFFVATYCITWTCFFAARSTEEAGLRGLLLFLGIFAPAFVALGLTGQATGWPGVAALLRRLVDWQVAARWYVFAIGFTVAVKLAAALLYRVAPGLGRALATSPGI